MENEFLKTFSYFFITIDPIHVGTGGYRLGSVDNTIMREPQTKIPKIPGSSISGVVKSYYPYVSSSKEEWNCITSDGGCGKENCIICYTFGFSKKGESGSQKGRAQFFDANIIMFPIFTTMGTKWITTPQILKDHFQLTVSDPSPDTAIAFQKSSNTNFIAVGWLSLKLKVEDVKIQKDSYPDLKYILDNLLVVNSEIFSFLINTNLEVRTSTSIDPKTGTVKEGALFTYEAIPRTTVLHTEISFFDYGFFKGTNERRNVALERLEKAVKLLSVIGLGGMNTRGFGRIKVVKR